MKMPKSFSQILLFTVLCAGFVLSATAQERKLLPADEAAKDASFVKFRNDLITAARKRDAKTILDAVAPDIKIGFGGSDGIANFKKQWKLNNPQSEFWSEFLFVMTHGGAFQQEGRSKSFWAPYIYSKFPEDLDAFEYSAVTDKNVRLLAKPANSARVVATLSYNLVKVDLTNSIKVRPNSERYSWIKVETLGGKKGFVEQKYVRSSVDYRAAFEKVRGQWKMTAFLAGD